LRREKKKKNETPVTQKLQWIWGGVVVKLDSEREKREGKALVHARKTKPGQEKGYRTGVVGLFLSG